jgi:hypothetical protein
VGHALPGQVALLAYQLQLEKLRRRNQFRTITVSAFPVDGALPSQVLNAAWRRLPAPSPLVTD